MCVHTLGPSLSPLGYLQSMLSPIYQDNIFIINYIDRLAKFRWVIPADDMITLKMKFISDEVGQIDQVLYHAISFTDHLHTYHMYVDIHF